MSRPHRGRALSIVQGTLADEAAARLHADRSLALTLVERVAAAGVAPGFGPLSAQVKDPFDAAFDSAIGSVPPARTEALTQRRRGTGLRHLGLSRAGRPTSLILSDGPPYAGSGIDDPGGAVDGTGMAYGSDGLRSGGGRATDAGQAAESATGRLLGSVIGAGAFGDVTGGDALVTGLDTTREAHARLGHDVSAAHAALTTDARGVADTGDELTAATRDIAASGGPGSISAGMLG